MRARGVLGFAFGLAAAALAACGGNAEQDRGNRHGLRPPKKDMIVVIYLDANCKAQKNDPSIGYDDRNVTFEFRGACATDDTLTFTPEDGLTDGCSNQQNPCTVKLVKSSADFTIHIKKRAYGSYNYSFTGAVIGTLDPGLEIDP